MGYDVLALFVVGFLVYEVIRRYHNRRLMAMRQEYANFEGWQRVALNPVRAEVWKCPDCRVPLFTWGDVAAHQDPERSPCAEKTAKREALEAAARELEGQEKPAQWTATVATRAAGAGAVDTMGDDPEGIEA